MLVAIFFAEDCNGISCFEKGCGPELMTYRAHFHEKLVLGATYKLWMNESEVLFFVFDGHTYDLCGDAPGCPEELGAGLFYLSESEAAFSVPPVDWNTAIVRLDRNGAPVEWAFAEAEVSYPNRSECDPRCHSGPGDIRIDMMPLHGGSGA